MNPDYLDFEQPIADLMAKIEQLHYVSSEEDSIDIVEEIENLEAKCADLTKSIYAKLGPAQISKVSRHPLRPYTMDYLPLIFSSFEELHGDRAFADDKAIISGIARLDNKPLAFIGQQKGRSTQDKVKHNFGMARPEGYRKAARIMKLAEKFSLPVITFIDTPGAYPGIGAEERGQSEAIASNLKLMANLRTPVIATVIGEGGSGGALAIGVADKVNMLQYSTYSVISPEGCASILWKSADKADIAAEAMGLTAQSLRKLGLIDEIILEPIGGAHRNLDEMAGNLKESLRRNLDEVSEQNIDEILATRYNKLMSFGNFEE